MQTRPWLATYQSTGVPADIDFQPCASIVEMLDQAMLEFAARPAFQVPGHTLSYRDVDQRSSAVAAWLQARLGVSKGMRIGVMLPNIAAFPVACLGILRAGAVQVNINPLYTPRELEHQLADAGCEIIVVFDGAVATLLQVLGKTPVRTVITANADDALGLDLAPQAWAQASALHPEVQFHGLRELLSAGGHMQRRPVDLRGDDLIFLQYTGGTTGLSKGAALSHYNLVANTQQFKAITAGVLRPGEEVVVTALPLYHIFALMVNFIVYFSVGAENWLVTNPRDMDGFIDILKVARPTVFVGVNTLYAGLAMHPRIGEVDFSRLRFSAGGGAAVVRVISDRWQAITGQFIREGYGLSETSPVLSFNPQSMQSFSGSTGLPLPGTDIVLLDEQDQPVALGESGEICAKGPQVMRGYWQQPQANAAAFTRDGYFRTGDVGVFDEAGFLKIVDRKKDMIIVSGFNVFPNEVEAVVSQCPGVAECACVGVPDERTGEAVKIVIVKRPGAVLTAESVASYCRSAMTAYKIPRRIEFVDALPKSAVGKILRRDLRDKT